MIDGLIYVLINFVCGAAVMIWHELPKSVAAHFLTHSVFRKNKLSLPNVKKYIDPIGLVLFAFSPFGVGWQKPYEHNPNKLVDKEKSLLILVIVGQVATLIVVVFLFPITKYLIIVDANRFVIYAASKLIAFNMALFIVNLLPVPPLDMSKVIHSISPNTYFRLMQNQRYIHSAFILLVAFGIIESFVAQILSPMIRLFL